MGMKNFKCYIWNVFWANHEHCKFSSSDKTTGNLPWLLTPSSPCTVANIRIHEFVAELAKTDHMKIEPLENLMFYNIFFSIQTVVQCFCTFLYRNRFYCPWGGSSSVKEVCAFLCWGIYWVRYVSFPFFFFLIWKRYIFDWHSLQRMHFCWIQSVFIMG